MADLTGHRENRKYFLRSITVSSDVSEVLLFSIKAMTEARSTSETSANFYQTTWRNNPKDNHLQ
jgi:hypothetical protein